ncbi:bis(5'-nucleosyl)-tetraphosphatase PrpE [Pontibacillus yanchengensis]|uniref:Bis(5'-nucleosyl)-tetraphosphatase PrpE [asymmetrical] n=1 Tax=Pontibacillus yanchengensis Y32 TaxID=1385514 RepID=A0A0A2TJW0_9BACI|nr:bis(5'-nucleosyl)-tetraphosphatase PrpE [Pontibacillus yanchengensis]KGP74341.1 bis(5'-nucleosyl)-tetraphosphatase [Pontibacillus yanchengensis Y32]
MKVDIIGDVHGCFDELFELFQKLGYTINDGVPEHEDGRTPIFVGDLPDRGPESLKVIHFVYELVVKHQKGHYVPGNHDNKLYRFFKGNNVQQKHGLETTVAEYEALPTDQQEKVKQRFKELYEHSPLYHVLPEANLVVAHAGIREDMIGRDDKKVHTFVLYGDITGEFHENGMPVRRDWAADYEGSRWIVYGHTPVRKPRFKNKTVNIDTGCVFGGALSAFRLPEEEIVSVPSKQPEVPEKFRTFDD